jgi:hypothetical protein
MGFMLVHSVLEVGWPSCARWIGLLSIISLFCYGLKYNLVILLLFWPIYGVFPCLTCKNK